MKKMTHTERIQAILAGEAADRIPFAAWGPHFNLEDCHEGDFTKALIAYQDRHGFDVMKVMSHGLYHLEDFGQKFDLPQHYDDKGYMMSTKAAFSSCADWLDAKGRDPYEGTMGREVRVIRNLKNHYGESVPILPTVFGPLRTLTGLSTSQFGSGIFRDGKKLRDVVEENEEAYRHVMDVLTQQVIDLMNAFVDAGAAGFFYCPGGDAVKNERGELTDGFDAAGYCRYIRPYDDRVLNAMAGKTWFNMAHIHGETHLRMEELVTLPNIQAVNWEDQLPDTPSLAQVRKMTDRVLMGGIDRMRDFLGADRDKVKSVLRMKTEEAVRQAGRKLIVSVGCEATRQSTFRFSVWNEVLDELAAEK